MSIVKASQDFRPNQPAVIRLMTNSGACCSRLERLLDALRPRRFCRECAGLENQWMCPMHFPSRGEYSGTESSYARRLRTTAQKHSVQACRRKLFKRFRKTRIISVRQDLAAQSLDTPMQDGCSAHRKMYRLTACAAAWNLRMPCTFELIVAALPVHGVVLAKAFDNTFAMCGQDCTLRSAKVCGSGSKMRLSDNEMDISVETWSCDVVQILLMGYA
eukprot:5666019-Pleurochrysis_carterae.AAC.2